MQNTIWFISIDTVYFPARTVSFQLDRILYWKYQSRTVYFPRLFPLLCRTVYFYFLIRKEFTFCSDDYYRLRQNEYSFVTDVLSCSYHPKECTCDATIINHRVEYHKISYGTVGLTFPCFQSKKDPKQVALSKSIQTSQMVHAVIWPVLGTFRFQNTVQFRQFP